MPYSRMQRVIALTALLLQAGCSDITGTASELARARQQWTSERPAAYDYTLTLSCFCGVEVTHAVVIVVRGNAVESRTYVETGDVVPAQYNSTFPTIDGMFDVITNAIDQRAAQVGVTYDPAFGFPTSIVLDGSISVADDESRYTLTDFHVR